MVLNDVLTIAAASATVAAGAQWWIGRGIHRRTVAALKKRHALAQQEAAELLSQCRRQIAQLKGDLDASAQKARQVRETALKVLANRPSRQDDELPAVRGWPGSDGFAATVQHEDGFSRHGFARTTMLEDMPPGYGRGFAETTVEDLPRPAPNRPQMGLATPRKFAWEGVVV